MTGPKVGKPHYTKASRSFDCATRSKGQQCIITIRGVAPREELESLTLGDVTVISRLRRQNTAIELTPDGSDLLAPARATTPAGGQRSEFDKKYPAGDYPSARDGVNN